MSCGATTITPRTACAAKSGGSQGFTYMNPGASFTRRSRAYDRQLQPRRSPRQSLHLLEQRVAFLAPVEICAHSTQGRAHVVKVHRQVCGKQAGDSHLHRCRPLMCSSSCLRLDGYDISHLVPTAVHRWSGTCTARGQRRKLQYSDALARSQAAFLLLSQAMWPTRTAARWPTRPREGHHTRVTL